MLEAFQFSPAARDSLSPATPAPRQHPLLLVPELCYVHRVTIDVVKLDQLTCRPAGHVSCTLTSITTVMKRAL